MKKQYPGFFLVIEGIDGSGKSTLANNLYLALKKMDKDCLLTFEPTKGQWGAMLRQSFTAASRLSPKEELALFRKDRQEHLEKVILPALRDGRIVICDRYFFSTVAYQGARGLDPEKILSDCLALFIEPDLCIFLEIDPREAIKRIRQGRNEKENNFEQLDYLIKVAEIYRRIRNGCIAIDATLPVNRLTNQVLDILLSRLKATSKN